MNELIYEEDCDMIDICKEIDNIFGICEAGASLVNTRCTPAEKAQIFLLNTISLKLDELIKSK